MIKKQLYMLGIVSLFVVSGNAQNAKPAAKPVATTPAVDESFCKEWKYTGAIEFSVDVPPTDSQKNDELKLTCDKKAVLIKDGETKNGTWSVDKGKTNLTVTVDGTKAQFRFRILKMEGNKLNLEWQDPDLIRHKLNYEAR